ncbi:GIY-YIG nuclease family protein [uncultured Zhongshania sp.]|uniref:GIY-YIG nuclease family protein n=1 Tax=Zhongshania aquimaris TaxID=2857107 RepID=UPI0025EB81A4|nr:GIY-YIG nuclease family protein [uncultured Zhongshania sp.]
MSSAWWVYMVRSRSGKLYTGITTDPERRFREHCGEGGRGARFFRTDPADAIVYREPAENRSTASQREAAIKKMRRSEKESLIIESKG